MFRFNPRIARVNQMEEPLISARLPRTVQEYQLDLSEGKSRGRNVKLIKHFIQPALDRSRPLGRAVIVLAGVNSAEKAATINTMFDDHVYKEDVRNRRHVKFFEKELTAVAENAPVGSSITFIELPGNNPDKATEEQLNLQNMKDVLAANLTDDRCTERVYPNVILLFSATGVNWIPGFELNMARIKACHLLDYARINLIVVVSRAGSLEQTYRYRKRKEQATNSIREKVREHLNIPNVRIVFVENSPNRLPISEGELFKKLPDDQRSHLNVLLAMHNMFKLNGDVLASLLCGWYFSLVVPDEEKEYVLPVTVPISLKDQPYSPPEEGTVQTFIFLGSGFCPARELTSGNHVFVKRKFRQVTKNGFTFDAPHYVDFSVNTGTHTYVKTHESHEQYAKAKKLAYGLEKDMPLVVDINVKRWKDVNLNRCDVVVRHERRMYSLSVKNPINYISEELNDHLERLPEKYDETTCYEFYEFFDRWCSHFITEVTVGGMAEVHITMQSEDFNEKMRRSLKKKFNALFRKLENQSFAELKLLPEFQSIANFQGSKVTFLDSNNEVLLQDMTPVVFNEWRNNIDNNRLELKPTLKLCPYYSLVKNKPRRAVLHQATKDYITIHMIQPRRNRDQIGQDLIAQALHYRQDKVRELGCFPSEAGVMTPKGSIGVADLFLGQNLLTVSQNPKNSSSPVLEGTTFYTYLHYDPDKVALFRQFDLANGRTLTISPDHLLFTSQELDELAKPIRAEQIVLRDNLMYVGSNGRMELTMVTGIKVVVKKGVFCPLTQHGTLIVDGFLVSSYSSIDSFSLAHISMAPLRLWYRIVNFLTGKRTGTECKRKESKGINVYAQMLMVLRENLSF